MIEIWMRNHLVSDRALHFVPMGAKCRALVSEHHLDDGEINK